MLDTPEKPSSLDISATRFLNSLLREWRDWSIETASGDVDAFPAGASVLVLRLPLSAIDVLVRVAYASRVGYWSFDYPIYLRRDSAMRRIELPELAMLIARETAGAEASIGPATAFIRRVLDSVANIDDYLARANDDASLFRERDPSFITAEQALRFGHATHPAPRSRDEFTREDARLFAPEHGADFTLRWWAADPSIAAGESADAPLRDVLETLANADGAPRPRANGFDPLLIPMHPWQAARLQLDPAVRALFERGSLWDLGNGEKPWRATSSLRSVHADHAPWMLKFSLSLRLTNSRRIVEARECDRGIEVTRVLAGRVGRSLRQRCPTLRVMGEPAHISLRSPDGATLTATTVVFRDNPFTGPKQQPAAVLAALCEIGPGGRDSHLAGLILRIAEKEGVSPHEAALAWFTRYLDVAVTPFLVAQAEFGLLFGAHQQNVVLALRDGWPEAVYFRDCQGAGYVRGFRDVLAADVPDIDAAAGHVFDAQESARLVGYYVFINGAFAVIAAIGLVGLATESVLLRILRRCLEALAATPLRDRSCIDYLLSSPTLSAKGNFMISLRNINENTDTTDPLAAYVEQPNPILGA